jgi:hypothetical protein
MITYSLGHNGVESEPSPATTSWQHGQFTDPLLNPSRSMRRGQQQNRCCQCSLCQPVASLVARSWVEDASGEIFELPLDGARNTSCCTSGAQTSRISLALRACYVGGKKRIVRRLCSRSASLRTRIRGSQTIAKTLSCRVLTSSSEHLLILT